MILISNRGNLRGPNPDRENTIGYILEALNLGLYVKIDIWNIDGEFFLGKDEPRSYITQAFLLKYKNRLVCQAKTPYTLFELTMMNIHCFSHSIDEVVLTSEKWLWTIPSGRITNRSIVYMPERSNCCVASCLGICSDYILD